MTTGTLGHVFTQVFAQARQVREEGYNQRVHRFHWVSSAQVRARLSCGHRNRLEPLLGAHPFQRAWAPREHSVNVEDYQLTWTTSVTSDRGSFCFGVNEWNEQAFASWCHDDGAVAAADRDWNNFRRCMRSCYDVDRGRLGWRIFLGSLHIYGQSYHSLSAVFDGTKDSHYGEL